jgi:hypothetical protein
MLRPRTDPDALAATFETAVATLTAAGSTVMVFTGFDPVAFPILRLVRGKAAVFSMHLRGIAAKYDCLLADLWPMRTLTDRRMWSADRLHLGPDGHRRVALLACEVTGVPVDGDWRAPLAERPLRPGLSGVARTWFTARWSDVEWMSEHAAPYLSRRLHGISIGDWHSAKRPSLAAVRAAASGGQLALGGQLAASGQLATGGPVLASSTHRMAVEPAFGARRVAVEPVFEPVFEPAEVLNSRVRADQPAQAVSP